MAKMELRVPDIGDFKEVEVIEVLVKLGDVVVADQSLVTVESDKASMEIPASAGGVVVEWLVKVGDKIGEGSLLGSVEAAGLATGATGGGGASTGSVGDAGLAAGATGGGGASTGSAGDAGRASRENNTRSSSTDVTPAVVSGAATTVSSASKADLETHMLVLGAGPGGYSAAFRAADLGLSTVLVERFGSLGGVCLNVGCIPSKALLHVAGVMDEAKSFADHGVTFGEPKVDLDKLRGWKEQVVGKLTGGLAGMAKARKVRVVQGAGRFVGAHEMDVTDAHGKVTRIRFAQAIIAAGSEAVRLPFLPDDPRVVTSTGALALRSQPGRMLVIGGGIIGLEMATVYSTLGARVDVVEMLDGLMLGADRDLVKVWQKFNAHRFDRIMLKTKTVGATAKADGIYVAFEGPDAPTAPERYDLVLQAVGRRPNGNAIGAEAAGIQTDDRGFIAVDRQMRTQQPHIFAIGDIVGQPMLAHKAVHEGHVAAEVAAGLKSFFDARVIPSVAYTDPEVAWVGVTEDEAKAAGLSVEKAVFPWAASGRAIANGRDEGLTKLLVDTKTHKVVGGGMVGTHAGDMIGELALAVEMGCDPTDIAKTIHPHPTLGETIGMVAEVFEGVCTDLPPTTRRQGS